MDEASAPFDIAIIGCGLIGAQVALGLLKRNIPVTVYERTTQLREIGAGIGLYGPALPCMEVIDPQIAAIVSRIAVKCPDFRWMDGLDPGHPGQDTKDLVPIMTLPNASEFDMNFCHRGALLQELLKCLPEACVKLGKGVSSVVRGGEGEKVRITFTDGTTAEADAVIGCDGVKSRVRREMLSPEDPSGVLHYAHESIYRCLIDMDKLSSSWMELAKEPTFFTGQHAHVGVYPIQGHRLLNVAACLQDDGDWPHGDTHVLQSSKTDMIAALSTFSPILQDLFNNFPDELSQWAIFDTLDHPLQSYAFGSVVLAGDAAHASTPHLGAGACMGVEDTMILMTLLEQAKKVLETDQRGARVADVLSEAFKVYDTIRRPRSQWLVESSRKRGRAMKSGQNQDSYSFLKETGELYNAVNKYDWRKAMQTATSMFDEAYPASSLEVPA